MPESSPPADILTISGLTKQYRSLTAVADLDLSLQAGEFVGLIGPNGAGKTTTMRCLAGMIGWDSGEILLNGVDVGSHPVDARRHLGYVPQDLEMFEYLTGEEYLSFVARVRTSDEPDQTAIDELLELTALDSARDRMVREYSGGMRQKLAVAAAMLGPPSLLVLDEAFVGLDPESVHRMKRSLSTYCADGGTVLLSSHNLEMIRALCSRVIILVDGTVGANLTSDEIDSRIDAGEVESLTDIYLDVADKRLD
jgi:ABC-2 type transport system ATP-binding protein